MAQILRVILLFCVFLFVLFALFPALFFVVLAVVLFFALTRGKKVKKRKAAPRKKSSFEKEPGIELQGKIEILQRDRVVEPHSHS